MRSPRVGDARSYITKSHGGMDFTHEEIGLLLEEATDIINLDEDQTIDAWITWAVNASFSTHVPNPYFVLTSICNLVSKPHCSGMAKLLCGSCGSSYAGNDQ